MSAMLLPITASRNRNHHSVVIMDAIQCKMARAALGWGVRKLAETAGVSTQTITRLERGEQLRDRTTETLKVAFEAAGIEFIPENGGGPGVRGRKKEQRPVSE
jgi:DNA-binding XRE family transcriptional regulator